MLDSFIKQKLLGLPVLASEHGDKVDNMIIYVHWLMAVLFVGWTAFFLYTIVRFRKSKHPKADYVGVKSHASSYIEVAVAVVEAVLLLVFAIPYWSIVVDKFPDPGKALAIHVVAEQFTWNARYAGADGILGKQNSQLVSKTNLFALDYSDPNAKDDFAANARDIHVPVGTNVIAYISSKDVIHCFKVLPLRVTQDAMPGLRIPVHFKTTKPGKYQITCAQLCGMGHSTMNGYFTVDSPDDYAKWVATQSKAGAAASSFE